MAMVEYLTDEGKELIAQMLAGRVITFTKIQMGDGTLATGQSRRSMTALVNTKAEIDVYRTEVSDEKVVSVMGIFDNSSMTSGFYFREKGVFASDGTTEILFAYANSGSSAEYINPPTVESVEKQIISLYTTLQDSETDVKITVKSGIYALKDDLEEFTKMNQNFNSRVSNCILEMPKNPTYNGADITVYAGTKMLFPDGKNADGTLKSIELTLPADITVTVVGLGNGGALIINHTGQLGYRHPNHTLEVEKFADLPATVADNYSYRAYVRSENKVYNTSSSTTASWHTYYAIVLGEYTWASNAITSLTPYKPFRIADYNEVNKSLDLKVNKTDVIESTAITESGKIMAGKKVAEEFSKINQSLATMNTNFQGGCSKIASAITANGVSTASNASPTTMSTNIGNIRSGGNLDSAGNQLLAGYTAYSGKVLRSGAMPNRGAWSANLNNTTNWQVYIPAGYHNGSGAARCYPQLERIYMGAAGGGSIGFNKSYKYVFFCLSAKRDVAFAHSFSVSGNYALDKEEYGTDSDDYYVVQLHMWDVVPGHVINFMADTQEWNGDVICWGVY